MVVEIGQYSVPEEFQGAIQRNDHTLLGVIPKDGYEKLVAEALSLGTLPNSLCVQGEDGVRAVQELLKRQGYRDRIKICAVGESDDHFPRTKLQPQQAEGGSIDWSKVPGLTDAGTKRTDAALAVNEGAQIFDMVANPVWIAEGKVERVADEIFAVRERLDHFSPNLPLRVICSTGFGSAVQGRDYLSRATEAVARAAEGRGPGQIVFKTETGHILKVDGKTGYGATVDMVAVLRSMLPSHVEIKASGGVTRENVLAMLGAGADWIGASGLVRGFLPADFWKGEGQAKGY